VYSSSKATVANWQLTVTFREHAFCATQAR